MQNRMSQKKFFGKVTLPMWVDIPFGVQIREKDHFTIVLKSSEILLYKGLSNFVYTFFIMMLLKGKNGDQYYPWQN